MSGFKVECNRCGNKTVLTSKADDYMGFEGSDISSSNSNQIVLSHVNKEVIIKCKCGNSIFDK